ncbi:MAG: alpha/beta hydrolase [Luteimonas sp.]
MPSFRLSQAFALVIVLGGLVAGLARANDRPPSAGPGVHVLPTPLAMPGLDRTRVIRVYLPPSYASSRKRYRVLYMHDGQNLFDDATSFVGEWGVDEAMDALARSDGIELIVVGIDHGDAERIHELTPWPNPKYGQAQGVQYMDFVVGTVKPYIDSHYRTRPGRKDTGIMGSSLGGLVTHYAMYRYPDVFSKAGVMSPSFWFSDQAYAAVVPGRLRRGTRIYMSIGDKEGDKDHAKYVADTLRMEKLERAVDPRHLDLQVHVIAGGEHNERTWRAEFPTAIRFLFGQHR